MMRIYDWHIAPNPRRLHIYLAEKGIKVELVEVGQEDLTLAPWYKEKYPHAMVPMLELDDGTRIGEAMAIARYFEETQPEPPLMGRDAKEKAIVDMWEKRANEEGMLPASELFRNTHRPSPTAACPARPSRSHRSRR
jgi:glutathione S-transferase